MQTLITLLTSRPNIDPPHNLISTLGLFLLLGLIGYGTFQAGKQNQVWGTRQWGILTGLILFSLVASLYLGLRLPNESALPMPLVPEEPPGPALMFLSAAPWVLAAGLLGVAPAVFIGLLCGFLTALFDTHTYFSLVQVAALALIFAASVRQRYRTPFYRLLRHPLGSGALLLPIFGILYFVITLLDISGPLVARVDYAITRFPAELLAVSIEILIAGLIAEVFYLVLPGVWGGRGPYEPSPAERSLQLRFFYGTAPLIFVLLLTLMIGDWIVAGQAARSMLQERLSNTAKIASNSIPYYLEAGQNLILKTATDPRLLSAPPNELTTILSQDLVTVPYFRQLYLYDRNGKPVTGYPLAKENQISISPEEKQGVQLALKGVSVQTYTVPPARGDSTAQVSFLAAIPGSDGSTQGVVLGRSDLASNPFTKPIIQSMDDMRKASLDLSGGGVYGTIIDDSGQILYTPIASRIMTKYPGKETDTPSFYDETGPDGTRNLVYYQPTVGHSWAVVLTAPAQLAQQMALTIAVPVLFMILVIALVAVVSLRFGLRVVTASLQTLSVEADRISAGQLNHPLVLKGEDEVGQLSRVFEQMRVSLKARLEELNRLLVVSQGVASTLEIQDAVRPILEAAHTDGASMARIALAEDPEQDAQLDLPSHFGIGAASELYGYLDEQILALSRQHDRLVLTNLGRGRGINFAPNQPHPSALMAVALRHENQFFGTLWVAFDQSRSFMEEDTRFLVTLAGEAALAAANARLYSSAEVGRQRLEAILVATPDPVLVTDQQNRLLLTNPAALQLPGLATTNERRRPPIDEVISQIDLLTLLRSPADTQSSREISFSNGKVYFATISSVGVDNQTVGKVCILRDITHYKQLDALKSDFVATVSHDLRSPLTLMRGYATMLQMVGDLNDQQKGYVRKIISGVESMARLVNNLLDLGRIEAGVGLQLELVPVKDVMERVTSSLQLQAAQKNIQLGQDLPGDAGPVIEADQALLQQALYNLVENAIKYTPVGGQVQVRVQVKTTSILFDVHDTGIGIAPLDQPRLFEKFYRGGQREAYQQRGSGLGLAIVKSIAERHGGRVWVESYLGKGSTFYLEVPFNQTPKANP